MENLMAKKTKRSVNKENPVITEKTTADVLTGNRPSGFNPDYQFVIKDIRRVGILAGSFLVILTALAIIVHL
jgi:hypothetical protein